MKFEEVLEAFREMLRKFAEWIKEVMKDIVVSLSKMDDNKNFVEKKLFIYNDYKNYLLKDQVISRKPMNYRIRNNC